MFASKERVGQALCLVCTRIAHGHAKRDTTSFSLNERKYEL